MHFKDISIQDNWYPTQIMRLHYYWSPPVFVSPHHHFVCPINKGKLFFSTLSFNPVQLAYPIQVFLLLVTLEDRQQVTYVSPALFGCAMENVVIGEITTTKHDLFYRHSVSRSETSGWQSLQSGWEDLQESENTLEIGAVKMPSIRNTRSGNILAAAKNTES